MPAGQTGFDDVTRIGSLCDVIGSRASRDTGTTGEAVRRDRWREFPSQGPSEMCSADADEC